MWCRNDTSCANAYNVAMALNCRDKVRNMSQSAEKLIIVENAIRGFANNLHHVRTIDCYKLDKLMVL